MYFMDDPLENWRLTEKTNASDVVNRYLKCFLSHHQNILDVGCGPGVISAKISTSCSSTKVFAIDNSFSKIEETIKNNKKNDNVLPCTADVLSIPFKDNSFDIVFARFVLEYIKYPQKAVSEIVRVCKPGGRIILQDLDGQLSWHFPEDHVIKDNVEKILSFLKKENGFDAFIGRKLYSFLYNSNVVDIDVDINGYNVFFGSIDEKNYKLWEIKLEIAMNGLVGNVIKDRKEADMLINKYLEHLLKKDTLTYSILFSVTGIKN